jgi:hypothetical protein
MLKRMVIDNFTVFGHAELEFGQLNVIHGENGTGKTHLLKLVHHMYRICSGQAANSITERQFFPVSEQASMLDLNANRRLSEAFGYNKRSDLIRWDSPSAKVQGLDNAGKGIALEIKEDELTTSTGLNGLIPWEPRSFYIPAQDVLGRDMVWLPLAQERSLREELLGLELRTQLMYPPLLALNDAANKVYESLILGIGWRPETDRNGDVYLLGVGENRGRRISARIGALGHIKIAVPALLVERFSDKPWSLIWDEPEANLNPRLIKVVAKALVDLAAAGVQVCVATHSLYLMREFVLLQAQDKDTDVRYFGLHHGKDGVEVTASNDLDDTGALAALDANLEQGDRYLAWGNDL